MARQGQLTAKDGLIPSFALGDAKAIYALAAGACIGVAAFLIGGTAGAATDGLKALQVGRMAH